MSEPSRNSGGIAVSLTRLKRVLIANRGEIAIRIARAAADVGMESVAVYTDADAQALHTQAATLSVHLPGNDPVAAHLDGARTCRRSAR